MIFASMLGASISEALGVAIGLTGAAYAASAFLKDKQLQLLEEDNRDLLEDRKGLKGIIKDLEEMLAKGNSELLGRIKELEESEAHYRVKCFELEEFRRQSDLFTAADMVRKFNERPKGEDQGDKG